MSKNVNELSSDIYEAVDHFLAHYLDYATDIVLAVNARTLEVKVESPKKLSADYTQYSIADYILTNDKGLYEADSKAAFALAQSILA